MSCVLQSLNGSIGTCNGRNGLSVGGNKSFKLHFKKITSPSVLFFHNECDSSKTSVPFFFVVAERIPEQRWKHHSSVYSRPHRKVFGGGLPASSRQVPSNFNTTTLSLCHSHESQWSFSLIPIGLSEKGGHLVDKEAYYCNNCTIAPAVEHMSFISWCCLSSSPFTVPLVHKSSVLMAGKGNLKMKTVIHQTCIITICVL